MSSWQNLTYSFAKKVKPYVSNLESLLKKISTENRPECIWNLIFVCLFGVLHRFQHFTGHITTGSWKGRGNQYI